MFPAMTAYDMPPRPSPGLPSRRRAGPGEPEGNERWRSLSDEPPGAYSEALNDDGVYLCFLACIRRAVDDLKPHNADDIQADAAEWLRTEGRRWIRRLKISRSCDDEDIRRLIYGGETCRQASIWEEGHADST